MARLTQCGRYIVPRCVDLLPCYHLPTTYHLCASYWLLYLLAISYPFARRREVHIHSLAFYHKFLCEYLSLADSFVRTAWAGFFFTCPIWTGAFAVYFTYSVICGRCWRTVTPVSCECSVERKADFVMDFAALGFVLLACWRSRFQALRERTLLRAFGLCSWKLVSVDPSKALSIHDQSVRTFAICRIFRSAQRRYA